MSDQSKSDTNAHQKPVMEAASYRPPFEQICPTCGGKHVGRCSLNACSDIGRAWEGVL